jgi:hypothetical protein
MSEHMHFAIAPGNDFSVHPERAIAFIERYQVGHDVLEKWGCGPRPGPSLLRKPRQPIDL